MVNQAFVTLNELQESVCAKLDGFAVLAGDGLALGSQQLPAAYKPLKFDDKASETASQAATAASGLTELMKRI